MDENKPLSKLTKHERLQLIKQKLAQIDSEREQGITHPHQSYTGKRGRSLYMKCPQCGHEFHFRKGQKRHYETY